MPTTLAERSAPAAQPSAAPAISPTANDVEGRLLIVPAGVSQDGRAIPLS